MQAGPVIEQLITEAIGEGYIGSSFIGINAYPLCPPQGLHQDQVIPTPSRVLDRISPIFSPFSPVFARFHRLDEAVPTSPKPESRATKQCQGRPNTVLAA